MCPSSLSKGVCLTTDCVLRHVSGTKMPLKEQNHHSQDASKHKNSERSENKKPKGSSSKGNAPADFLEAIKLLKVELMEAMEIKLEARLSNQAATQPRPTIPAGTKSQPGTVDRDCSRVCHCQPCPWQQTTHMTPPAHCGSHPGWPPLQKTALPSC